VCYVLTHFIYLSDIGAYFGFVRRKVAAVSRVMYLFALYGK
jgi:hypothetical protein